MINSINNSATNTYSKASNVETTSSAAVLSSIDELIATQEVAEENVDTFEVTAESATTSGVYTVEDFTGTSSNSTESSDGITVDVNALKTAMSESFSNMLSKMLGEQIAETATTTVTDVFNDAIESAQEAISEGGEWSPENVANNILDMAKSLAGDDPENFAILKEAVEKGFEAAADLWGGELPSITDETYKLVMEGFDAWETELFGTATEETAPETTTVI